MSQPTGRSMILSVLLLVLLASASCSQPETTPTTVPAPVYWPTEGWRVSTPEEQGMDSQRLAHMLADITKREVAINTVLVVRNGYLVMEANVWPFQPRARHMILSITKSVASALVGMAIERGFIDNVEKPVLSFFPDRQVEDRDARKEAMTLEHLLTMTSGLDCEQDEYVVGEMVASDDWVQYVLDLPMVADPGETFTYCTVNSFLLSAILQQTTGKNAQIFAEEHLFAPLGIDGAVWSSSPGGVSRGGVGLGMVPGDLAKIGQLYLHRGLWEGSQVVPAAWVEASAWEHIAESRHGGYGYQWWVQKPGFFARLGLTRFTPVFDARGYGGQFIFVVPSHNIVVVVCGWMKGADQIIPIELLQSAILPAAQPSGPMPPNPEGLAALQTQISELARPTRQSEQSLTLPPMAADISGKTYRLQGSRYNFNSFSLEFREDEAVLKLMMGAGDEGCTVGLDGTFRITNTGGAHDIACKGQWSDDHTFELDWTEVGANQRHVVTFSFEGRSATLIASSSTLGVIDRMTGSQMQ
jgi:CubicO group peptidase (beta-lactamase class C family)